MTWKHVNESPEVIGLRAASTSSAEYGVAVAWRERQVEELDERLVEHWPLGSLEAGCGQRWVLEVERADEDDGREAG